MITKEKFKELVNNYTTFNKKLETLSAVISTGIFDSPLVESYWLMFEEVMKAYFTEAGYDDIMWWLIEKDGDPNMKMWDKDNNEIPTETIDDLWNIVESSRI